MNNALVYWHRKDFWCEVYSQDMNYEINFQFRIFEPRIDSSQIIWLADENQIIRRLHVILQIDSFDSVLYYFMSMNFVVTFRLSLRFWNKIKIFMKQIWCNNISHKRWKHHKSDSNTRKNVSNNFWQIYLK